MLGVGQKSDECHVTGRTPATGGCSASGKSPTNVPRRVEVFQLENARCRAEVRRMSCDGQNSSNGRMLGVGQKSNECPATGRSPSTGECSVSGRSRVEDGKWWSGGTPASGGGPAKCRASGGCPAKCKALGGGPAKSRASGGGPTKSRASGGGPAKCRASGGGPAKCMASGGGPAKSRASGGGPAKCRASGGGPAKCMASGGGPAKSKASGGGPAKCRASGGGPAEQRRQGGGPGTNYSYGRSRTEELSLSLPYSLDTASKDPGLHLFLRKLQPHSLLSRLFQPQAITESHWIFNGFALGQAAPNVSSLTKGQVAASTLIIMIENVSNVSEQSNGAVLPQVQRQSEFCEMEELMHSFYKPTSGKILLDGHDIKVFSASIAKNILHGKEDVGITDIINAAKIANAHCVIQSLPNGYSTKVEESFHLSRGQK
ncbi:hypothetical protein IEQ34_001934 [Dendrobium chrysotoxum]|uniref:Uncharacterized protein n=1 Tax=Dendrobium chrysotoxum TaxID=161865 RepID=A0AAV7HIL7_DENCH|nr:hypothetical protein IEQ34_001934 [Dendrobium chrysotoxum]